MPAVNSRHTFPAPIMKEQPYPFHITRANYHCQYGDLLLCLLVYLNEKPKYQVAAITLVLVRPLLHPLVKHPSPATKTSKPAVPKVTGAQSTSAKWVTGSHGENGSCTCIGLSKTLSQK